MSQHRSTFKSRFYAVVFVFSMVCIVGCPDYSHLRPEPDYSNMTDSAGESDDLAAESADR